jgi:spermidine/putrescine transport system ATP-binding protein
MPQNGRTALSVDSLVKRFGTETAVDGVSLEVATGEFFALLGPSGCGKTTTLRVVAGLESPTAGAVRLAGSEVTDVPTSQRNVNMVFQDLVLFPHMSVRENVAYGLKRDGVPADERRERVDEMLSLVQLREYDSTDPMDLSGGQQQRVALARALASSPDVLLLDEPLSSLDRQLRQEMQVELQRIQAETGATFLYVTHDQDSAMSMADRLAIMRDGAVVEVGSPDAVYEHPSSAFAARFLGDAAILSGTVVDASTGRVSIPALDTTVSVGSGRAGRDGTPSAAEPVGDGGDEGEQLAERANGDSVTVVVRPENVQLGGPVDGRVVARSFKGFYDEYEIEVADRRIKIRDDVASPPAVGSEIGLTVTAGSIVDSS